MRFTITPLGGSRRDLGAVVDAIVDYLQPRSKGITNPAGGGPAGESASRYYADGGEEPGRWIGRGAAAHRLEGEVAPADLAAVLGGRDPRTGERLRTAQGSAGRRPDLGAGQATRLGPDGTVLYGEADAAAVLGITKSEVSRLLDVGSAVALARLTIAPTGDRENHRARDRAHTMSQVRGSYLVPIEGDDGTRWISEGELLSCSSARQHDVAPELVQALGEDDDRLPIAEAARLAGVTTRYLRRLAATYEKDRDRIDRRLAAGEHPRGAFLIAERGTRDQWLVTRRELVTFLARRTPPAVRVGFDLTLTTEKSLGVLALLSTSEVGSRVLAAIQAGNDTGMRWIEHHAARARQGGRSIPADGWTVASFRHLTSRALDPFPHHHNVVANAVRLPDGSPRTLDARFLSRHGHAASAVATAEMRHRLTTDLGVRWRPGRKGGWEVDGISDEVIQEFSQRRGEIDDALAELEAALGRGADPAEVEGIALRTRPAKRHVPAAELLGSWRERATALGLDAGALARVCGRDDHIGQPPVDRIWARLAGPHGVCAGGSIFSRGDLLAFLADLDVGEEGRPRLLLVEAEGLERLADEFLASRHVVPHRRGRPLHHCRDARRAAADRQPLLDHSPPVLARRAGLDRRPGAAHGPLSSDHRAEAPRPFLVRIEPALLRRGRSSGRWQDHLGGGMRRCVARLRSAGRRRRREGRGGAHPRGGDGG